MKIVKDLLLLGDPVCIGPSTDIWIYVVNYVVLYKIREDGKYSCHRRRYGDTDRIP